MRNHPPSTRRVLRPLVVAVSIVVLAGLALVAGSVFLGGSSSADDASAVSVSGFEGVPFAQRDDPWPTGPVAEMIGASNPDEAIAYRAALVADCMAERDLAYVDDFDRITFMLDRLDRDGVAQLGFGLGIDSPPEPVGTSPNSDLLAEMNAEEVEFWQINYDLCLTEALDTEQAVLDDALGALPDGLQREVVGLRFYEHPDLAEPIAEWSACLAEAGYDYAHPLVMIESIGADYGASGLPLAELQDRERAIAVANYDCRYEILAPAFDAVLADLTARIQDHLPQPTLFSTND